MKQKRREGKRGTALVSVTVVVASLATVSATVVARVESTRREERQAREIEAARLISEGGMKMAFAVMQEGGDPVSGSENLPVEFDGGSLWTQLADLGDGKSELTSFGEAQGQRVRTELVLEEVIVAEPSYGVFGDELLWISQNAFIDSYKSADGSYASQALNSDGNDVWANDKGDTGSNSDIHITQNAGIHGNATPGVGQSVILEGTAAVSGSMLPAGEAFVMPTLDPPPGASVIDMEVGGTEFLPSGVYYFDDLLLKSNSVLNVEGPVTFVLDSLTMKSNAQLLVDDTNGGATFFVEDDFVLESNTLLATTSKTPANLAVNLKGNNVIDPGVDVEIDPNLEIGFKSNSQMYGTLFAPNAYVEIRSNFELFGSLMARRLVVASNSMIHFDESLNDSEEEQKIVYEVVGWRTVTESN